MKDTKHGALNQETKAGSTGTLYRVPCSCGWRGAWWLSATEAELSYIRHENGIAVQFVPRVAVGAINVEGIE